MDQLQPCSGEYGVTVVHHRAVYTSTAHRGDRKSSSSVCYTYSTAWRRFQISSNVVHINLCPLVLFVCFTLNLNNMDNMSHVSWLYIILKTPPTLPVGQNWRMLTRRISHSLAYGSCSSFLPARLPSSEITVELHKKCACHIWFVLLIFSMAERPYLNFT